MKTEPEIKVTLENLKETLDKIYQVLDAIATSTPDQARDTFVNTVGILAKIRALEWILEIPEAETYIPPTEKQANKQPHKQ